MTQLPRIIVAALFLLLASSSFADDFVPMFNGRNLDGWVNVNTAPSTWRFDGPEFNRILICDGKPTGVLRTEKRYRNFVLELDYMHLVPKGNAGIFIWSDPLTAQGQPFTRSIEVQVLDGLNTASYTSHGDIFPIHGAVMTPDRPHPNGGMRCLPSERRAQPAGEWNHYRITAIDGTIKLEVNGKEVSGGSNCSPREGYICLESEGGTVWWKNVRIKELPDDGTELPADQRAAMPEGFRSMYNGVDFTGWKITPDLRQHWKCQDWILDFDGKHGDLWSEESFGDVELIVDWRWNGPSQGKMQRPLIEPDGSYTVDENGKQVTVEIEERDSGIYLRGNSKSQVNIWEWPAGSGEVYGYRTDGSMPAETRAGATPKKNADRPVGEWNRFRIRMVGETLNVHLNGEHVLVDCPLPGVPETGPIGLQAHGSGIQFANLYVRRLNPDGTPVAE
jgi:hypothetical protein